MNIKIFGHPYHSLEYYFLDKYDVYELLLEDNEDLKDISKIDFIDGVFSIVIENGDKTTIITDPYGLYPLFYNTETLDVINYFALNSFKYYINPDYIKLNALNLDKSYHSNLDPSPINMHTYTFRVFDEFIIPFITPFVDWYVTPPGMIITIDKKTMCINYKRYNLLSKLYPDSPENIIKECVLETSFGRKVLLPLSAGYDSRAIMSILYNRRKVFRYTYGSEAEFVDKYFNIFGLPNCITDNITDNFDFNDNYDTYVEKFIFYMNGMGDMYYKVHNLTIQHNYNSYDIMYTGDGHNEFIGSNVFPSFWSARYATGDGHHFKTQCDNIICAPPYCQKRYINSVFNIRSEATRKAISRRIINNNYKLFNNIKFYTGDSYTKNRYSNFGHKFDFNTKEKYLQKFYRDIL